MVAEVTGPGTGVVSALESRPTRIDKTVAAPPSGGSATSGEVVKITDLAAKLQTLTQAVAEVPEVDQQRVDTLRQAIAVGSYEIAPRAVADKLIAFESLLGAPSSK